MPQDYVREIRLRADARVGPLWYSWLRPRIVNRLPRA